MPPRAAVARSNVQKSSHTTKRKADADIDDTSSSSLKRRRQNGAPAKAVDSDEEDAGFAFTRPPKQKKLAAPTRASPRNHVASTRLLHTTTTPKAAKPTDTVAINLSNNSDSFVALPVSDTPIIRKNQALRQGITDGRRRTSLSMRGKRASSIGNGFHSLPHPDVPTSEFYKHISEDLPDPVRMKQLLAWCARRTIDDSKLRASTDKSETDEDLQALHIAKQIAEEVLKDLIDNKISTSWYQREEIDAEQIEKRPHPQNVANAQKLKEIEERLRTLEAEEQAWNDLSEQRPAEPLIIPDSIDLDLLSAAEAEFVHAQQSRTHSTEDWLRDGERDLEFQVDCLLQGLHRHQQTLLATSVAASEVLKEAGELTSAPSKTPTIDVLRQITRT